MSRKIPPDALLNGAVGFPFPISTLRDTPPPNRSEAKPAPSPPLQAPLAQAAGLPQSGGFLLCGAAQ
jgi:hypothetical protein